MLTIARLPTLTEVCSVLSVGILALALQVVGIEYFTRSSEQRTAQLQRCVVEIFREDGFFIASDTVARAKGSIVGRQTEGRDITVDFDADGATTVAFDVRGPDSYQTEARRIGTELARVCLDLPTRQ